MPLDSGFGAYVVERQGDQIRHGPSTLRLDDLPAGDVLIQVEWSGINHKDAMTIEPGNKVARISPLVPGVDLAGVVVSSDDPSLPEGTQVMAGGFDIGVARHGGFAAYARLPSSMVMRLPPGLDSRRAMTAGTAGLSAMLSLEALEAHGLRPGAGPVLVTAASGGVGSFALAILAAAGYQVVASTGKLAEADWLTSLGASSVIGRSDLEVEQKRVLGPETYAAAIDSAGGRTLAQVLRLLSYGGAVAASGLVAGSALEGSIFPFVIRGVSLLGIDSVMVPMERREQAWRRLAHLVPASVFDSLVATEVGLETLTEALERVLQGRVRGRILLRHQP
jgi:acrylyl-CoA reductase (NADPH)